MFVGFMCFFFDHVIVRGYKTPRWTSTRVIRETLEVRRQKKSEKLSFEGGLDKAERTELERIKRVTTELLKLVESCNIETFVFPRTFLL